MVSRRRACCHRTPTLAWCGRTTAPLPHLTSPHLAVLRQGTRQTALGLLPGVAQLSAPHGRAQRPTLALPHARPTCEPRRPPREPPTRRGERQARPRATLPTCCHLGAKTATRMRAAACTGAASRAPMQYARNCAALASGCAARRLCRPAAPEHAHCRRRRRHYHSAGQRSAQSAAAARPPRERAPPPAGAAQYLCRCVPRQSPCLSVRPPTPLPPAPPLPP